MAPCKTRHDQNLDKLHQFFEYLLSLSVDDNVRKSLPPSHTNNLERLYNNTTTGYTKWTHQFKGVRMMTLGATTFSITTLRTQFKECNAQQNVTWCLRWMPLCWVSNIYCYADCRGIWHRQVIVCDKLCVPFWPGQCPPPLGNKNTPYNKANYITLIYSSFLYVENTRSPLFHDFF